jgi:hypothetical protein
MTAKLAASPSRQAGARRRGERNRWRTKIAKQSAVPSWCGRPETWVTPFRYRCLRAGHAWNGDPGRTRTCDQQLRSTLHLGHLSCVLKDLQRPETVLRGALCRLCDPAAAVPGVGCCCAAAILQTLPAVGAGLHYGAHDRQWRGDHRVFRSGADTRATAGGNGALM